jgi:hypothetical protein
MFYDPWGTPESGVVPTFGFIGELHDTATGLVNLRVRWYNPRCGRFGLCSTFVNIPNKATPFAILVPGGHGGPAVQVSVLGSGAFVLCSHTVNLCTTYASI